MASKDIKFLKLSIKEGSEINLITRYVELYLLIKKISISPLSVKILSYFIFYGINEKSFDYLMNFKIVKSKGQISNNLTLFRKHGLIKKQKLTGIKSNKVIKSKHDVICDDLNLNEFDNSRLAMSISIVLNPENKSKENGD